MSSDPFDFFDPGKQASHLAKVEISPSGHYPAQPGPPANKAMPYPNQAQSKPVAYPASKPVYPEIGESLPPSSKPSSHAPANPYYPQAVPHQHAPSSHAPSGHAPQPHKPHQQYPAQAPVQAPISRGPTSHGAPSHHVPPGKPHSHAPSNPYAAQQAQAGYPSGPYSLPHQPSAPQFKQAPQAHQPQQAQQAQQPNPYAAQKQPQKQPSPQHAPSMVPSQLNPSKASPYPVPTFPTGPEVPLSQHHKQQFLDCGYTIVPDIVSRELRAKALMAINRSLGKNANLNRTTTSCPELISTAPILDLFHVSGVSSLTSQLLGPGFYPPPLSFINLQYPGDGCIDEDKSVDEEGWRLLERGQPAPNLDLKPIPQWQSYWKIDGLPAPANGPNDENHKIRNYSLLVGVYLNDTDVENAGNVTLWPGSHLELQQVLRNRGGTAATLKSGKLDRPVVHHLTIDTTPQQITAKAGDVLLCHYQVAHTHAPNLSPDIRYIVFFRVYSKSHTPNTFRPEAMDNVFLDYEGLYELIGKSHSK